MVKYIVQFCHKTEEELNLEQRNLLQSAFKNLLGNKRASWRVINLIERKEGRKGTNMNTEKAASYKLEIEKEIIAICDDMLDLVNKVLLPKVQSDEGFICFYKIIGDYNRYVAEISMEGNDDVEVLKQRVKDGHEAYLNAEKKASEIMLACDPIRLGLALNMSVMQKEIFEDNENALAFAKDAFDEAVKCFQDLDPSKMKEASLIMQLIKDNLILWRLPEKP